MSFEHKNGTTVEVRIRKEHFARITREAPSDMLHIFQKMLSEPRRGEVCGIKVDHKRREGRTLMGKQAVNIEIAPNVHKRLAMDCLEIVRVLEPA